MGCWMMLALPLVPLPYCFKLLAMGIYYFNKNSCLDSTHTIKQVWTTFVASLFLDNMRSCDPGDSILAGSAGLGRRSLEGQTQYVGLPRFACLSPPPHVSTTTSSPDHCYVAPPSPKRELQFLHFPCHGGSYSSYGVQIGLGRQDPQRFWFLYHLQTQKKGVCLLIAL